ncbi:MAG: hypothetical protein ACXWML_05930 [Candidatus Binataceae bacterium]
MCWPRFRNSASAPIQVSASTLLNSAGPYKIDLAFARHDERARNDFTQQIGPSITDLGRLSKIAVRRAPGPLEQYVAARLNKKRQSKFVDAMPLHAAIRLCETTGAILLTPYEAAHYGPRARIERNRGLRFSRGGRSVRPELFVSFQQPFALACLGMWNPVAQESQKTSGALAQKCSGKSRLAHGLFPCLESVRSYNSTPVGLRASAFQKPPDQLTAVVGGDHAGVGAGERVLRLYDLDLAVADVREIAQIADPHQRNRSSGSTR